jgi:hypothetical protein
MMSQPDLTWAAYRAGVIGAMDALWSILSARMAVLVAIAGGIGLAWLCLSSPDPYRLGILGIYSALIVIPVIWLASRS